MNKLVPAFLFAILLLAACSGEEPKKETASDPGVVKDAGLPKPKAPAPTGAPRILFVGNSHTDYYISIPKMFGELCAFNKQEMKTDELVEMGISLEEIYNTDKEKAEKLFAQTDADGNYYDYVVLQEKTPVVLQEAGKYKASVKMLLEKIKKNSPGVAAYIYELASPEAYGENKTQFEEFHKEMRKNTVAVIADNSNAGMYRVGDALKDAYEGANGYSYQAAGKDNLRFGQNTLHILNDGGFLAATLLYTTLYGKKPSIPEQMTFSAGTGDGDGQKQLPVKTAVSNPDALLEIAMKDR